GIRQSAQTVQRVVYIRIRAAVGCRESRPVRRRVVGVAVRVRLSRQERVLRARADQSAHVVVGEAVGAGWIGGLLDLAYQVVDKTGRGDVGIGDAGEVVLVVVSIRRLLPILVRYRSTSAS